MRQVAIEREPVKSVRSYGGAHELHLVRDPTQRNGSNETQTRQLGVELHVDDICGCGEAWNIRDLVACLSDDVYLRGGDINEIGEPYDHLKRLRTKVEFGIELRPNQQHLQSVLVALKLTVASDAPTPGVPRHTALLGPSPELKPHEVSVYRSCGGDVAAVHT